MKEKQILFDRDKGRLELSEKAVQLLRLVPEDGSYVGNTFLRRSLGWPDENEYWAARQELLDTGIIQTGKGRGGSVALASLPTKKGEGRTADVTAATAAEEIVSEIEEKLAKGGELVGEETELYDPLKKWIESTLGRPVEEVGDYFLVKVTASPSGRKRESGQWSRPDVTSVQVNTYDLVPHPDVEVSSYEVKRYGDGPNLSSVFEAASHSRWAHFTYLVVEDSETTPLALSERFMKELVRYDVGLIKMARHDDSYKFVEALEPGFQPPESKDLDELLKGFFADDEKNLKKFKRAIGR